MNVEQRIAGADEPNRDVCNQDPRWGWRSKKEHKSTKYTILLKRRIFGESGSHLSWAGTAVALSALRLRLQNLNTSVNTIVALGNKLQEQMSRMATELGCDWGGAGCVVFASIKPKYIG